MEASSIDEWLVLRIALAVREQDADQAGVGWCRSLGEWTQVRAAPAVEPSARELVDPHWAQLALRRATSL